MKVPRPPKSGKVKAKAEVEEIYSDHIIMRGKKEDVNGLNFNYLGGGGGGAVKHRGSILASHPAALGSNPFSGDISSI